MSARIDRFLRRFDGVRDRTRRLAERIPPDRVEWAPRDGAFTCGDLVRHIAVVERYVWAEITLGRPSTYTSHGTELADGYDAVIAFLDRMHAESKEIFQKISDEAMDGRIVAPAGREVKLSTWLELMVEHEAHHRGQLYTTLGLLGIATPPLYGLTSEEVRAFNRAMPRSQRS